MLPPLLLALADGDASALRGFAAAIAAVLAVGVPCGLIKSKDRPLGARDGFVTVALAWIIISLFGAIPFYASGVIGSVSDAVFETMSGFTTTGASILRAVEDLPKCLLFWRSFTHWLGGMGVLVFMLAIVPLSGESIYLLRAESPGPSVSKMVPKMRTSAARRRPPDAPQAGRRGEFPRDASGLDHSARLYRKGQPCDLDRNGGHRFREGGRRAGTFRRARAERP